MGIKSIIGWRNTYESSQIIELLLPDVLKDTDRLDKSTLTVSGDINHLVIEFPLDTTFMAEKNITISKKGKDPVYLTLYQHEWNKNSVEKQKDFIIKTRFDTNSDNLGAGTLSS